MREHLEQRVRSELNRSRKQIDRLRMSAYLLKLELRDRHEAVIAVLDLKWRELRRCWVELSAEPGNEQATAELECARRRLWEAIDDARWVGPGRHRFRDEPASSAGVTKHIG